MASARAVANRTVERHRRSTGPARASTRRASRPRGCTSTRPPRRRGPHRPDLLRGPLGRARTPARRPSRSSHERAVVGLQSAAGFHEGRPLADRLVSSAGQRARAAVRGAAADDADERLHPLVVVVRPARPARPWWAAGRSPARYDASLRWCSRATDIGTITTPVRARRPRPPRAPTSAASPAARPTAASPDVVGEHQLLVGEVGESRSRPRRSRRAPWRPRPPAARRTAGSVQALPVDRQPHQAHVQLAGAEPRLLAVLLDRHQLQRLAGTARARPGPLVRGRPGDEPDPERGCHHAPRLVPRPHPAGVRGLPGAHPP